jgi:hypothetical protein
LDGNFNAGGPLDGLTAAFVAKTLCVGKFNQFKQAPAWLPEHLDNHHPKDRDRELEHLSYREDIEWANSSRESLL